MNIEAMLRANARELEYQMDRLSDWMCPPGWQRPHDSDTWAIAGDWWEQQSGSTSEVKCLLCRQMAVKGGQSDIAMKLLKWRMQSGQKLLHRRTV